MQYDEIYLICSSVLVCLCDVCCRVVVLGLSEVVLVPYLDAVTVM